MIVRKKSRANCNARTRRQTICKNLVVYGIIPYIRCLWFIDFPARCRYWLDSTYAKITYMRESFWTSVKAIFASSHCKLLPSTYTLIKPHAKHLLLANNTLAIRPNTIAQRVLQYTSRRRWLGRTRGIAVIGSDNKVVRSDLWGP